MRKLENQSNSFLSKEVFSNACAVLPLVSIDLIVTRPCHLGRELLLGLRMNSPAKGWWFTPGGRVRKNEPFTTALQRIAKVEIGLKDDWLNRAEPLGIWDHFYPDSAFSSDISTHYINLPHALHLRAEEAQTLSLPTGEVAQHNAWQWIQIEEAKNNSSVHNYVQAVLGRLHQI